MNWLSQWLPARTGRLRKIAPHIEAVAAHQYPLGGDMVVTQAQHSVYQQSPTVYMAVNRIAEAGALAALNVYQRTGEQRIAIENHPLEQLLNAPNPHMSRFELFEQTLGMLELTGNAYWLLVGDARGQPAEIWTLRPDRVTIVPDAEQYVRGYVYEIDGKRIPLESVEVIHFKRGHPANDYYGLSALEAARLTLHTDKAMAQWNYNTFGKDNGVPAGILSIKDYVSDADFERLKHEWRANYGGTKRRTAFLRGASIEWQHIGLSHADLDFLQGRRAHRDEILMVFGVPIGLVSENATEANAKVAERQFIERTLYPKLVRLAQKISQALLPFYAGDLIAEFEDIRPTDTQARLHEIQAARSVLSINEIRSRFYALPPVTWGLLPADNAATRTPVSAPELPVMPDDDMDATEEMPAIDASKAALNELAQWERFALRRLDKPATRPFKVAALPDEIAFEISAQLCVAADKHAIQQVFAAARQSLTEDEVTMTAV